MNITNYWFGKGLYFCFLSLLIFEFNERAEDFFGGVSIVVGVCNMMLGYSETLKEMPLNIWQKEEEEKAERGDSSDSIDSEADSEIGKDKTKGKKVVKKKL